MLDFFSKLVDTSDFPPRWYCGIWTSGHGWLHIVSDLGIWSAYLAIPIVLAYFLSRRPDLPFRNVFLLFVAFILFCGTTHLMEVIIFWWPAYRLAGLIKLGTAIVSWMTVFALIKIVPIFLTMRLPEELEKEIQARKAAEGQIKKLNEDLHRRVQEIAMANHELAKAARMKDEFLASMSHELRTPLNGVLALSEALQEEVYGPISKDQISALKDIEQSGKHLLTLINDILDLSKIQAGKVSLDVAALSVEGACQSAVRLVKEMAQKKHLKLDLKIGSGIAWIKADERRLKQMLVNLLSNAVKFTPDGGKIGLEVNADEEKETITFTVHDTGIGISQEDMKSLFQPFHQIDNSLSRQYSGTGLGLALVLRMAELHGGSVGLDSELGMGSRFHLVLPWIKADVAEPSEPRTASHPLPFKRALIIEDSGHDSSQLARYLGEWNIGSFVHPRVEGAIQRVLDEQPDIILLDIQLPDGDGWDLLASLKERESTRSIPVLIISVVESRTKAQVQGAQGSLVKPVNRQILLEGLHKAASPQVKPTSDERPSESQDVNRPLVLLAEDNEVNARTVRDFLVSQGYRVELAQDGVQAVAMARELSPRLILMDIQMPGMDGLEATRQLRKEPATRNIPILAVTALAMQGDRERCLEAGASEYITKPLSLKQLKSLVNGLVRKNGE